MPDPISVKVVEYAHQNWKLILDGAVAFGTILLAVVTVWGDNFKKMLSKTNLKSDVGKVTPFIEIRETQQGKSSEGTIVFIRLKINNLKNIVANNCYGIINSYWRKREKGDAYYEEQINPSYFLWCNEEKNYSINKEIPSYLVIAFLKKVEVKTQDSNTVSENNPSTSDYKLFMAIKEPGGESQILLGKGVFIIPISIYGENLRKPLGVNVKVYWNGSNPSKLDEFSIEIVDGFMKEKQK
jgi:hypothetical protein